MSNQRIPVVPTIVVVAAIATMIMLGFWQLGRMQEKEAMLARYATSSQSELLVDYADALLDPETMLYRRARYTCNLVSPDVAWRASAGRNADGASGYAHYFQCSHPIRNGRYQAAEVALGWSSDPARPNWPGGEVVGVISPGGAYGFSLVAEQPQAGLQRLARPDPANLPNNHLAYAVQWFFFALTALVIYILALRRRGR